MKQKRPIVQKLRLLNQPTVALPNIRQLNLTAFVSIFKQG